MLIPQKMVELIKQWIVRFRRGWQWREITWAWRNYSNAILISIASLDVDIPESFQMMFFGVFLGGDARSKISESPGSSILISWESLKSRYNFFNLQIGESTIIFVFLIEFRFLYSIASLLASIPDPRLSVPQKAHPSLPLATGRTWRLGVEIRASCFECCWLSSGTRPVPL